jgi:5,10-methylenetetrahydrofolate reductase
MELRRGLDNKELEEAKKKSELDRVIRDLEKGADVHVTLLYFNKDHSSFAYFKMKVNGKELIINPVFYVDNRESLHQFQFKYKGVSQNTPPADSDDPTYYS